MRRAILLSLLFCFTLVTLVPSNVFVAANKRYFSEDFEGSEVDLSENWLERSAYGTSEGDWDDRIVLILQTAATKYTDVVEQK